MIALRPGLSSYVLDLEKPNENPNTVSRCKCLSVIMYVLLTFSVTFGVTYKFIDASKNKYKDWESFKSIFKDHKTLTASTILLDLHTIVVLIVLIYDLIKIFCGNKDYFLSTKGMLNRIHTVSNTIYDEMVNVKNRLLGIESNIATMNQDFNNRFDRMDNRFDQIDNKFDGMNQDFNNRFDELKNLIESIKNNQDTKNHIIDIHGIL